MWGAIATAALAAVLASSVFIYARFKANDYVREAQVARCRRQWVVSTFVVVILAILAAYLANYLARSVAMPAAVGVLGAGVYLGLTKLMWRRHSDALHAVISLDRLINAVLIIRCRQWDDRGGSATDIVMDFRPALARALRRGPLKKSGDVDAEVETIMKRIRYPLDRGQFRDAAEVIRAQALDNNLQEWLVAIQRNVKRDNKEIYDAIKQDPDRALSIDV